MTDLAPGFEIRMRPIDEIRPNPRNARRHSAEQVERIAAAIREFSWTYPILVDGEGQIVAGHGRHLAAQHLGLKTVPVLERSDWTPAQVKAYALADNRLAELAEWDDDLLRLELTDLVGLDFNMELIGFTPRDIAALLSPNGGQTDPDELPAPPSTPVTVLGDVWRLGAHRLRCGDSTDKETVATLFAGASPHLMVTDPPYGVKYDAAWRPNIKTLRADGSKFSSGQHATGVVENDDRADWREAWALFEGDVAYVWHGGNKAVIAGESLEATGLVIRAQIIWSKPVHVIGRGHYHGQHEPCWYAVRKGKTGHWNGGRKQTTVWDIPNMHRTQGSVDDGKTSHSTQKPVECMKRPIENNSQPADRVYDPFMGSGTTLIAAEMTGRICFGIELNPAYVDIAVLRWQKFTGKQAVRETTGESFDNRAAFLAGLVDADDDKAGSRTSVMPGLSDRP